jgi:MFS family permease
MKRLFFNRALRILLFTNALILLASAMTGPIYALFVEKVGGDLLDASLTGGVFALAAGITTLIAGRFSDRKGLEKIILLAGYFITGVGFLLYMFVDSTLDLLLVQVLLGFAGAIYSPSFDSLYSKHICLCKAGREWSMWEATNYFTAGIGAIGGGFIVTILGFNALFALMALLCFLSVMYICLLPKKII